jgi:hypothetical protein
MGEGDHQPFGTDPETFGDRDEQIDGLVPRKANGPPHGPHLAAASELLRMEQATDEDHAREYAPDENGQEPADFFDKWRGEVTNVRVCRPRVQSGDYGAHH